jgi:alginate O-acetyltransferase complex protein AlgI
LLFNAPLFLFGFLPALLAAHFLLPARLRNATLLTASALFYAWGEPRFIFVVIGSALLDWICGFLIARAREPYARLALVAGVAANLAMLLYFKYTNFFLDSLNEALGKNASPLLSIAPIALPVGVSFIVFEKITYLVDLRRGVGSLARSPLDYLLYVLFFPKLLAGPIVKYHEIEAQLGKRRVTFDDVGQGFLRFTLGLAKKVFIADTMGEIVDPIFALAPEQLSFQLAWLGICAFTLQIYFDFSGYSDMAIGLARLFGFRLRENFNQPYAATSFTDFWRRWHISLSSWIREYLYLPLGGNRGSAVRTYVNLWICFVLSGLWHGAKWTFVLWGVYQGIFLVIDRVTWLRVVPKIPPFVARASTLLLVILGWVLFRAESFSGAVSYYKALFHLNVASAPYIDFTTNLGFFLIVGWVIVLLPWFMERASTAWRERLTSSAASAWIWVGALAIFSLCLSKAMAARFNPFLYFRF